MILTSRTISPLLGEIRLSSLDLVLLPPSSNIPTFIFLFDESNDPEFTSIKLLFLNGASFVAHGEMAFMLISEFSICLTAIPGLMFYF